MRSGAGRSWQAAETEAFRGAGLRRVQCDEAPVPRIVIPRRYFERREVEGWIEDAPHRVPRSSSRRVAASIFMDQAGGSGMVKGLRALRSPGIQVLPLTGDVMSLALELCERYGITRQRYYDAQIVATMLVHGIGTILSENDRHFRCMTEIRAVNPIRST